MSDQWAVYGGTSQLNVNPPCFHSTVSHVHEFVNEDGDATNHINKAIWSRSKQTVTVYLLISMNLCGDSDTVAQQLTALKTFLIIF